MNLIAIIGPTSSGKSELAVDLAGVLPETWIVNYDSRQVYKKLNIGTGKVFGKWCNKNNLKAFYYKNRPHFLIDYVDPLNSFSLNQFIQDFVGLFTKKVPQNVILVGGTNLYVQAVLKEYDFWVLDKPWQMKIDAYKAYLRQKNLQELQDLYHTANQNKRILNDADYANSRRLVTWLVEDKFFYSERSLIKGKKIVYPGFLNKKALLLKKDWLEIKSNIKSNVFQRIDSGLLQEVESLKELSDSKFWSLGLDYRLTHLYLKGFLTKEEWVEALLRENTKYAKRQLTWMKNQQGTRVSSYEESLTAVSEFLV
jgi:tRNA dimethylallyltransferase